MPTEPERIAEIWAAASAQIEIEWPLSQRRFASIIQRGFFEDRISGATLTGPQVTTATNYRKGFRDIARIRDTAQDAVDTPGMLASQITWPDCSDPVDDAEAAIVPGAHSHAIADTTGLQAALDAKAAASHAHAIGDVTSLQSSLDGKAAASHTHAIADTTGLQAALDGKAASSHNHDASYQPLATILTNTTASFTSAQETKLAGIADGATANSTDATLLARANHTGTQAAATITGLAAVATSGAKADVGLANVENTALSTWAGSANITTLGTIASGTVPVARVSGLAASATTDTTSASNISSGTLPDGRFPATLPSASGANLTALNGSNITSGTVAAARLPDAGSAVKGAVTPPGGTTTFLRADGTWAAPSGSTNSYAIHVQALTSSPTDAQTIYFGNMPKAPVTTAATSRIYVRETCTITAAEIYCYSGTAGTNEAWSLYIRKNNTTDTLIATVAAATSERVFSATGLSISMAAGDYFEIKAVNPTWATNPLTTIFGGYVKIQT